MLRAFVRSLQLNLEPDSEQTLSREQTLQKASAALLVEISRSDDEIHSDELKKISEILKQRYQLSESECDELLNDSQDHVENSVSLHEFTRLLNEHLTREERTSMVEDLWKVAFADQVLDKHEEYMVRKIAELLYVSQKDFIQTKLKTMGQSE